MNFVDFDYVEFWALHQHALPSGPPMIAQPTIRRGSSSWIPIFNHNKWPNDSWTKAAASNFVEQQTPVFDAGFWLWFVQQTEELQVYQSIGWVVGGSVRPAVNQPLVEQSVCQSVSWLVCQLVPQDPRNRAHARMHARMHARTYARTHARRISKWSLLWIG